MHHHTAVDVFEVLPQLNIESRSKFQVITPSLASDTASPASIFEVPNL